MIRNLLSNAIKFTPQGGHISISIKNDYSSVKVFIKDSGTGMNPETLRKINENSFFTTKGTANESGTGLGLMLCKEFLAKNGGRMSVESEEGKGSTFSFTLPGIH
ncbi:MAG: ATP-binding protein [Chitinophagaceae bacterium]